MPCWSPRYWFSIITWGLPDLYTGLNSVPQELPINRVATVAVTSSEGRYILNPFFHRVAMFIIPQKKQLALLSLKYQLRNQPFAFYHKIPGEGEEWGLLLNTPLSEIFCGKDAVVRMFLDVCFYDRFKKNIPWTQSCGNGQFCCHFRHSSGYWTLWTLSAYL